MPYYTITVGCRKTILANILRSCELHRSTHNDGNCKTDPLLEPGALETHVYFAHQSTLKFWHTFYCLHPHSGNFDCIKRRTGRSRFFAKIAKLRMVIPHKARIGCIHKKIFKFIYAEVNTRESKCYSKMKVRSGCGKGKLQRILVYLAVLTGISPHIQANFDPLRG